MLQLRKFLPKISLGILLLVVFLISIPTVWDPDIWFHVKSGEIIMQQGIIHRDVFSYVTAGREWFPYEWLFQVIVYNFQHVFGFEAIKYLVAAISTLMVFGMFTIFRRVLNLNYILSLTFSFFFFVSTQEFIAPRPHLFAYTFFVVNLGLILLYYFKNKNYLWITLPVTLAWSNLHGSMFLSAALFFGYAVTSLINLKILKEKIWLKKFKIFTLFGFLSAILTVLPPLWLTQYRLLWMFFQNSQLVSRFIDEWAPIGANLHALIIYSTTISLIFLTLILVVYKKKLFKKSLWVLPLLILPFTPYLASRNIVLSYIALSLILAWSIGQIEFKNLSKGLQKGLISLLIIFLSANIYLLYLKYQEEGSTQFYYPIQASQFIKNYHLQGNMFNEYGQGSYLLYQLYPQQKVFFDGRTDLYLCCEIPYTLNLAVEKNLPDPQYKAVLDALWNKYNISFVLMRTEKHVLLRKIGRILQDDPNWSLVFWDDNSQLFVRRDGKNDQIIKQFGAQAATPYNQDPLRPGTDDQAFKEYQKMLGVADSAKSRNALGYLLLKQKKFDEAKSEFEKAIQIYPLDESPYMNLAELSVRDGDLQKAIDLYQKAQQLAPDRGLIYIRLGQLTLQKENDSQKAQEIWLEGIKNTVDTDSREQLRKLIVNQK